MIYTFLSSLSSFAQTTSSLHNIADWPNLSEITDAFFLQYSTEHLADEEYIDFSRHPRGWNIFVANFDNEKVSEELFWSAEQHDYMAISFLELTDEEFNEQGEVNLKLRKSVLEEELFFRYNLYYGYATWEEDVINLLEPQLSSLSITDLDFLARAYSSLGRKLIAPNVSERGTNYAAFDSTFLLSDLNTDAINSYYKLAKKSIDAYRIIKDKDYSYRSFTGRIQTVVSNEYLTAYWQLAMIGQVELARDFLVDDLYSPLLISLAKNLLNSCRKDAILITQGDSDLYLLTYLQEKYGYRKDITLMNKGLLNWGRNINYLTHLSPQPVRLNSTLGSKAYGANRNDFILISKTLAEGRKISINRLIKMISEAPEKLPRYNGYMQIPDNLLLSIDRQSGPKFLSEIESLWDNDTLRSSWRIDASYVTKSELFIWDLMVTEQMRRPLYIVTSTDSRYHLDDYLVNSGLVDEIFLFPTSSRPTPPIDLLDMTFDFSGGPEEIEKIDLEFWIGNIKFSYYRAIDEAIDNENTDRAISLLDHVNQTFSQAYPYYQLIDIYFGQSYDRLNQSEKAKSLLKEIFHQQRDVFFELTANSDDYEEERIISTVQLIKYSYSFLEDILKGKELTEITDIYKQVEQEYESF